MNDSSYPITARVGLVGLGLMGTAMTERLLAAGVTPCGWDLDPARRAAFTALGGICADSAVDVFRFKQILLSLPSHETVRTVIADVRAHLRPGQFLIDTSTGDPTAAEELGRDLATQGIHYLDATVSGSSQHLREGSAVFLVGGNPDTVAACRELLTFLTPQIHATGPVGSGARMKLVTNLVLGLNRAALAEGLWFARSLGLDLEQTLFLLRQSLSYSRIMDTKGEKMLHGDFTPQARLSQHWKDVHLMLESAARHAAELPLTQVHEQLLARAISLGLGELDNSAIARVFGQPHNNDTGSSR